MSADDRLLELVRRPEIAGEFNWFDDPPEERLELDHAPAGRLMVALADGTPTGIVGWVGVPYGPNRRSVARKIGITLLPEFRGMGYGAEAQRALAEHLFVTTPCNRVEADCDVMNVAEQRALKAAGFRRDGLIRGAQFRGGRWHDLLMYSILRADV